MKVHVFLKTIINFKRNTLKLLQKIKEIWNLGSYFNGMSDLGDYLGTSAKKGKKASPRPIFYHSSPNARLASVTSFRRCQDFQLLYSLPYCKWLIDLIFYLNEFTIFFSFEKKNEGWMNDPFGSRGSPRRQISWSSDLRLLPVLMKSNHHAETTQSQAFCLSDPVPLSSCVGCSRQNVGSMGLWLLVCLPLLFWSLWAI